MKQVKSGDTATLTTSTPPAEAKKTKGSSSAAAVRQVKKAVVDGDRVERPKREKKQVVRTPLSTELLVDAQEVIDGWLRGTGFAIEASTLGESVRDMRLGLYHAIGGCYERWRTFHERPQDLAGDPIPPDLSKLDVDYLRMVVAEDYLWLKERGSELRSFLGRDLQKDLNELRDGMGHNPENSADRRALIDELLRLQPLQQRLAKLFQSLEGADEPWHLSLDSSTLFRLHALQPRKGSTEEAIQQALFDLRRAFPEYDDGGFKVWINERTLYPFAATKCVKDLLDRLGFLDRITS